MKNYFKFYCRQKIRPKTCDCFWKKIPENWIKSIEKFEKIWRPKKAFCLKKFLYVNAKTDRKYIKKCIEKFLNELPPQGTNDRGRLDNFLLKKISEKFVVNKLKLIKHGNLKLINYDGKVYHFGDLESNL